MTNFIDIDPEFKRDPRTGDVAVVTDDESVRKSIVGLIQTYVFDRPFEPEIRSSVADLEFRPESTTDSVTSYMYETTIGEVINRYEPRASFIQANVSFPDSYTVRAKIYFRLINDPERVRDLEVRLQ